MNITITQLEYIVAVDTHRNFAKAAAHCFITQPTLSMQIKKLEQQLGILIFDRSKKPVKPTKVGEKVIAQARNSIHSLSRIHEIIQDSKGDIEGGLRIGIIPTLAPYLLPRFVNSMVKNYPKTQLIIEELLSEQILERLDNDLLDIGIMVPPLTQKQVDYIQPFAAGFKQRAQGRKEVNMGIPTEPAGSTHIFYPFKPYG